MSNNEVQIIWREIESLENLHDHSIEVYYKFGNESHEKFMVAWVALDGWYHRTSDRAIVYIIPAKSKEYLSRRLDGDKIIEEVWKRLSPYILKRRLPPPDDLGPVLDYWING